MPNSRQSNLQFVFVVLCVFLGFSSLKAQTKESIHETDYVIRNKFLVYGDLVDETENKMLKTSKDIWFYRFTPTHKGYVETNDGDEIEGDFRMKKVFNKAYTMTVTVDGVKKDHPDGEIYYEVHISNNEGKRSFKTTDLKRYGLYYTMADYDEPEKAYGKGVGYLNDGTELIGYFRSIYYKGNPYEGFYNYGRIYFAPDENTPVKCYLSRDVEQVNVITSGTEKEYRSYNNTLVRTDHFVDAFTDKNAKKNKFLPLAKATVITADGLKLVGKVTLEDSKKINKAIFMTEDRSRIINLHETSFRNIQVGGDYYVNYERDIVIFSELMEKWNKKGELMPAKLGFEDGREVDGRIVFDRMDNMIKSYRLIRGVYFIPSGSKGEIRYHNREDLEFIQVNEEGVVNKYVPVGYYFVEYSKFLEELASNDSKNPEENLQPGYLMLSDGTKREGQLAITGRTVTLLDANKKMSQYSPGNEELDYFVQNVNNELKKYKGMNKRSAVSSYVYRFVEIKEPFGRFSYYDNPYPTNIREGLTNFTASVIETTVAQGSEKLAKEAAKASAKQTYKKTGDLSEAAKSANSSYNQTKDIASGIEVSDEGGIYYDEIILVDNKTGEEYVLFKANDKELLEDMLKDCPRYQSLDKSKARRLTNMANIQETIQYLNSCDL